MPPVDSPQLQNVDPHEKFNHKLNKKAKVTKPQKADTVTPIQHNE